MPVEMRLEDVQAPCRVLPRAPEAEAEIAPDPGSAAIPAHDAPGDGAAVLRDLVAAGLVSHEVIGDPARLGPEPTALRALCGLVAGPVYRLEPFHYAFALRDGDLGGALAGCEAAERIAALDAALATTLGPDAVWIGVADLPSETQAVPEPLPEAALMLLCAQDSATGLGLAAAGPGLRAVIDAHLVAETARRATDFVAALGLVTAGQASARDTAAALEAAALDRRLGALEARLETLLEARGAEADAAADARAEARAFEARLGLALAEFLARLERRAGTPAPAA